MNNYDQSSEGVSLELSCFYDTDLAHLDFESSFEKIGEYSLLNSRFGNVPLLSYTESGCYAEVAPHDPQFYDYKKADLVDMLESAEAVSFISSSKLCDLATEYHGKSYKRLTIAEIFEYLDYEFSNASDLAYLYYTHLTPKFSVLEVMGYSQGDYCEVIIPEGVTVTDDYLTNLIYNAPVYCRLLVDNEAYYLDEGLKDQYEYDEQELYTCASESIDHEKKAYILEWLENNLPVQPNYK